jgi:hypothetical protein
MVIPGSAFDARKSGQLAILTAQVPAENTKNKRPRDVAPSKQATPEGRAPETSGLPIASGEKLSENGGACPFQTRRPGSKK